MCNVSCCDKSRLTTKVLPYALQSSSEFRPAGPPLFGKRCGTCFIHIGTSTQQQLIDQMMQLVNISGQLTDLEKSIADYWAGGLGTNTPRKTVFDEEINEPSWSMAQPSN